VTTSASKARVLFVGRGRVTLPMPSWLAKKWDALSDVFDLRVLNAGSGGGDPRFRLLPDAAPLFYSLLVPEVVRELRSYRPDVVVAADPYVGAGVLAARRLSRGKAKVIVEVHGDPTTFTRLYGADARKLLSHSADAVSRTTIRHADATRALSAFTSSIIEAARGLPATACFPTYSDLSAFYDPPLVPIPEEPRVVFVGALERYKNVDGLAEAWRRVVRKLPDARLTIVGRGSRHEVIDRLVQELPGHVEHHAELAPPAVAHELDRARALVLPSWPEGLGRVVLEAFARGRTVVATNAGGIPDIVTDGIDGILLPPGDTDALVAGLERILGDQALAGTLGAAGHAASAAWHQTADQFSQAYRDLVERVLAGAR
jgi:glycogen(starch) synthase